MNKFKVGDLISSSYASSLYVITRVSEEDSRYYVECLLDWDSAGSHSSTMKWYVLFKSSQIPTFETMLRYEKLKRKLGGE